MPQTNVSHHELRRTEDQLLSHIDLKFDVIVTQIKNQNENLKNQGLRQDKIISAMVDNQTEIKETLATHKAYWKVSGAAIIVIAGCLASLAVAVLT